MYSLFRTRTCSARVLVHLIALDRSPRACLASIAAGAQELGGCNSTLRQRAAISVGGLLRRGGREYSRGMTSRVSFCVGGMFRVRSPAEMKQSLQVLPTAARKATGNYGDCETLRSRLDIPARGGMGALAGRTGRLSTYWNVDAQQQQRANRCNRWLVVPAAQPAQVPGTRSGCDVAQSELLPVV